jgi:hypothetical protein
MRRRNAAVTVVLAATAIGGTAVAVLPAGASVAPAHAMAAAVSASPAVTIRAIDREGKQVAVTASLQGLGGQYGPQLTSAHATPVPKGKYVVAASVLEPGGKGVTFADREITVSGPETIVFDARKGKPLRFTVDDPTVTLSQVDVEVFSPATGADLSSRASGGPVYAIPAALPAGWYFYVVASLARPNVAISPVQYGLTRMFKGTIPASLTFASRRSALADEHVAVRQIAAGDREYLGFTPAAPNNSFLPFPDPGTTVSQYGTAPFSYDVYLTPGWRWQPCVQYAYNLYSSCESVAAAALPVLAAGHRYPQTFGAAVFGPTGIAASVTGSTLQTGGESGAPWFAPFADPGYATGSDTLPFATSRAWLYQGSTLLGQQTQGPPSPAGVQAFGISSATHMYRLHFSATPAVGRLFKSVTLDYTFPAHAVSSGGYTIDVFWPRIVPGGLDGLNQAPAGAGRTPVGIWFESGIGRTIAPHAVKVWASANGGKSWTALRVTRSGARWSVAVADRTGFMSLRVQATDAAGVTTSVTVINAYAVR